MSKSRGPTMELVICVRAGGYAASLERRKVHRMIPDANARKHRQLRVIDESGEDYLYPAAFFIAIDLPAPTRRAVLELA